MTAFTDVLIFAYGSNMLTTRLLQRAPGATAVCVGSISEYTFAYRKRGVDGSSKADAAFTGNPADRVWGVVYRISHEEKRALDVFEHLGVGYDDKEVDVETDGSVLRAWTYMARPEAVDDSLHPFSWYAQLVISGAQQHALPADYIRVLQSRETVPDPDRKRHRRWMRLISDHSS